MKRIGEELRRIRGIKGLTLRQVEELTGISNAYLSQLETGGAANPSPRILYKLSEVYDVPYDALMTSAGHLERQPDSRRVPSAVNAALMGEDLTEEEQTRVTDFIEFLRLQRKAKPKHSLPILAKPESHLDLTRLAERTLREADAIGELPTPIDRLMEVSDISQMESGRAKMRYAAQLGNEASAVFQAAWQKIRGIADLRERVVYVPSDTRSPREFFAKGHELGHQVIPWHKIHRDYYEDDDLTLSPATEKKFEMEANFFSSEVIFQGKFFRARALDFKPSLDAVFKLADEHGSSRHAALRRYVEDHDEAILGVPYWPNDYDSDNEDPRILRAGKGFASSLFQQKFGDVDLPQRLSSGHAWAQAHETGDKCADEIRLSCGTNLVIFEWESWWNNYCLFVLLRRKPLLATVGRTVRDRRSRQ